MGDLVANAEMLEDEIRGTFQLFDENKDGVLQKKELAAMLRHLGLPAEKGDVDAAHKAMDDNADGKVVFEEFKLQYNQLKSAVNARKMAEVAAAEAAAADRIAAETPLWAKARDMEIALTTPKPAPPPRRSSKAALVTPPPPPPPKPAAGAESPSQTEPDLPLYRGRASLSEVESLDRSSRPATYLYVCSAAGAGDMQTERDYLHQYVFPDVAARCDRLDLPPFVAVDLRWGVDETAGEGEGGAAPGPPPLADGALAAALAEIDRCVSTSAGASFLFLSGERYGHQPLPGRVPAAEMDLIANEVKRQAAFPGAMAAVETWYRLDANAVPAAYALRPAAAVKRDPLAPPKFADWTGDAAAGILPAEQLLATALRDAAAKAKSLSADRLQSYSMSCQHKEVRAAMAALGPAPGNRALVLRRTLLGLRKKITEEEARDAAHMQKVTDRLYAGLSSTVLETDAAKARSAHLAAEDLLPLLDAMRGPDLTGVPESAVAQRSTPWRTKPVSMAEDGDYVRKAGAWCYAALAKAADAAAAGVSRPEPLAVEVAAHAVVAGKQAAAFRGRSKLLASVVAMAVPHIWPGQLKVVWGRSGVGKTALLASAAVSVDGLPDGAVTLTRFVGTTAESGSARGVLRSLCLQLLRAGRQPAGDAAAVPDDLKSLAPHFTKLLSEIASEKRPVRIFLDSLDALSDDEGGRSRLFEWLPVAVPGWCSLTVSTLPDDDGPVKYGVLPQIQDKKMRQKFTQDFRHPAHDKHVLRWMSGKPGVPWFCDVCKAKPAGTRRMRCQPCSFDCCKACRDKAERLQEPDFVEVGALPAAEAAELLTALLSSRGRTVTEAQQAALLAGAATKPGLTALQLRLLALEGARWASYDASPPPTLPGDVPGLVSRLFDRLESVHHRGLASLVLGLLAASQAGLSHRNLQDCIAGSDDLLGWPGKRGALFEHGAPPIRRCPPLAFSRLMAALGEFLVERGGPAGITTLALSHRAFAAAAAKRYLATEADRARLLGLLADLFSGALAARHPLRGIDAHSRPLALALPVAASRACRSAQALGELPAALLALSELPASSRPSALSALCGLDLIAGAAREGKLHELTARLVAAVVQGQVATGRSVTGAVPGFGLPADAVVDPTKALQAELADTLRWLQLSAFQISRMPEMAYVAAQNAPRGCAPERSLRALCTPPPAGAPPGTAPPLDMTGTWQLAAPPPFPACLGVLEGHAGWVNVVAFSPDGGLVASGAEDNAVRLWAASTGELIRILSGPFGAVRALCFSPRGDALALGSYDTSVQAFDVATGAQLRVFEGHTDTITGVAYSPDGACLASCSSDRSLKTWTASTGDRLLSVEEHFGGAVTCCCYSGDGRVIAAGCADGLVRLINTDSGELIKAFSGHTNCVRSVAYAVDNRTLASGADDSTIRVYNTAAAPGAELLSVIEGHVGGVNSLVFQPDGEAILSGSDDASVQLTSVADGLVLKTFRGHKYQVEGVAFSSDGLSVASCSRDKSVRLWSVRAVESETRDGIKVVAFSQDGVTMASAGYGSKVVRLESAVTFVLLRTLEGHQKQVLALAFSPDGKTLASGSDDRTIRLWSCATGDLLMAALEGHGAHAVRSLAFTPEGDVLLSGSRGSTLRHWAPGTGKQLTTAEGDSNFVGRDAFSSDGTMVASGSGNDVRLWHAQTGALLRVLRGLHGHRAEVLCVAFSPDSKTLASGARDNACKIWTVATGEIVRTLEGHSGTIYCIAYSASGALLATGGGDRTVRIWDAATGALGEVKHVNERGVPRPKPAILEGHQGTVTAVAFFDTATLWTRSRDETAKAWSLASGALLNTLKEKHADIPSDIFGQTVPDRPPAIVNSASCLYSEEGHSLLVPPAASGAVRIQPRMVFEARLTPSVMHVGIETQAAAATRGKPRAAGLFVLFKEGPVHRYTATEAPAPPAAVEEPSALRALPTKAPKPGPRVTVRSGSDMSAVTGAGRSLAGAGGMQSVRLPAKSALSQSGASTPAATARSNASTPV